MLRMNKNDINCIRLTFQDRRQNEQIYIYKQKHVWLGQKDKYISKINLYHFKMKKMFLKFISNENIHSYAYNSLAYISRQNQGHYFFFLFFSRQRARSLGHDSKRYPSNYLLPVCYREGELIEQQWCSLNRKKKQKEYKVVKLSYDQCLWLGNRDSDGTLNAYLIFMSTILPRSCGKTMSVRDDGWCSKKL